MGEEVRLKNLGFEYLYLNVGGKNVVECVRSNKGRILIVLFMYWICINISVWEIIIEGLLNVYLLMDLIEISYNELIVYVYIYILCFYFKNCIF